VAQTPDFRPKKPHKSFPVTILRISLLMRGFYGRQLSVTLCAGGF
jgi:hypothetical protein